MDDRARLREKLAPQPKAAANDNEVAEEDDAKLLPKKYLKG